MAVMLSELISQSQRQFELKVVAGAENMEVPVNWVHLVEDTAVADYFWGGELVLTTGVGQQGGHWLLELLQVLYRSHCSGVILNTGQYILEPPQEAVDYCNRVGLPLLTMPWHIHLSEVIQVYCIRIVNETQRDSLISKAIVRAIQAPMDESRYLPTLQDYYNVDGSFQIIMFRIDHPDSMEMQQRLQTGDTLRMVLSLVLRRFTLTRFEDFYLLVLNDETAETAREVAMQIILRCANHQPSLAAYVGVGCAVTGVKNLQNTYLRARAAARMADYFKQNLIFFRDMGIYQLLFTAEDPDILEGFRDDNLGALEEYDRQHGSSLTETLYYFLITGGSIKAVAEAMYTHRNTINYRLTRIRELLGTELDDADERTRYRMAFYARDILEKMHQAHHPSPASPGAWAGTA